MPRVATTVFVSVVEVHHHRKEVAVVAGVLHVEVATAEEAHTGTTAAGN